jgi:hypothetical protein
LDGVVGAAMEIGMIGPPASGQSQEGPGALPSELQQAVSHVVPWVRTQPFV